TSFKRKTGLSSQKPPAGTRTSPALSTIYLTSSGIPSLDDVLGGGIQLGTSLLLLNPDPHSAHTELVQKYFIAQGLACDQEVYVFDPQGKDLVESCMWIPSANMAPPVLDEDDAMNGSEEKVKIAWRYERMQKFKTTVSSHLLDQEDYCRPFDLSSRIPIAIVENFLNAERLHIQSDVFFGTEDVFEAVIRRIGNIVKPSGASSAQGTQRAIRLSIPALASPVWGDPSPEKIVHFLLRLRSILCGQPLSCVLITLPSHICADSWGADGWVNKLGWVTDACITLSSFIADPSNAALFPSHHGLLKIHKLPCVQTLVPASDRFSSLRGLSAPPSTISSGGVGENNLAFKCTRKRLVIETFHLDVEGGVGERRTTPASSSNMFQDRAAEADVPSKHLHLADDHDSIAAIEVKLEETKPLKAQLADDTGNTEKKVVQKKPKKKVGFQVDRPDLYDF
ncbi:PAXNEB-domain-containing protein, partial [Phellopilus nigrolimitatus]